METKAEKVQAVKKRKSIYNPVAMKKYRDSKKEQTAKVTIEGVSKESFIAFKKQCEILGLSQRELFEKTFK